MLLTNRPLKEKEIFEVKLDRLNNRWTSSLMIGALFESPEKLHLPVTALGLKKNAIVISGETLFQNGHKMSETTLGFNIDTLIGLVRKNDSISSHYKKEMKHDYKRA